MLDQNRAPKVTKIHLNILRGAELLHLLPAAPQADVDRFDAIKLLPVRKPRKRQKPRLSLEALATPHDPKKKRYVGSHEKPRNRAHRLHIIKTGEGRGAHLSAEYAVPSDDQALPVKRSSNGDQCAIELPEISR